MLLKLRQFNNPGSGLYESWNSKIWAVCSIDLIE